MISEALHQHQPSSGINSNLSHLPSRYLKPTIFLSSKQNTIKPIFHDIKTADQARYFKKYFGHHKVTYVKRSTQLASAIHSRRFLQKISFDKGICQKDGFKSSLDMIILGKNIKTSERFSKKVLKGFRGKLSLAFRKGAKNIARYLKSNLNHLQDLEITLQKIDQFGFNRRAFDGLKSLQSFSLKFDPKFEKECGWGNRIKTLDFNSDSPQRNPLSFLFLLLQKTHLKRLQLNLAPYPLSSFALSYLLLSIEQVNTPEWYVRSGMLAEALVELTGGKVIQPNPDFPLHLTNPSEVIQKIDFFGLYVINYILENHHEEWHSDECGSKEFSPQILSKIPQLTTKSRKVLDITLTEKVKKPIPITTLLEKFSSLEGLYIKAPESTLTFHKESEFPERNDVYQRRNSDSEDEMNVGNQSEDDEMDLESQPEDEVKPEKEPKIQAKDFAWMKNLKQALLSIVDANYKGSHANRSHKPFEDLMRHLKDYCPTLELLNVFSASTTYIGNHGVTARGENAVKIPCKSLAGFNSLQELEINTDENGLKGVTKTLESLNNLRKLRLNFCDNTKPFTLGEKRNQWDDQKENIFDGLAQLKEFELFVRPDQSRDECDPTPLHWARYFAKNLHKLPNLEVLRVFDSKETQIELEVFIGLLKALSQLTSLKEIVIHSKITINIEALAMAADLYEDASGTVEDRLIGVIKSKVNRVIGLNPNLRLIDIRSLENMKIGCIFYKAQ